MVKKHERKWNKKLITIAFAFGVSLSGCGKQVETVTDYGNTTEPGETTNTSTSVEQKTGVLPDVQEDGDPIYEDTFSLSGKQIELSITSVSRDTDLLRTYKVAKITRDRIYEDEVVKNLFGDTAKKVDDSVGNDEIAPGRIGHLNCRIAAAYEELWQRCFPEETTEVFPTWEDGEDFFWHTYEGDFEGVTYRLLIAYREKHKQKQIIFYPKNPGDLLNKPECTEMLSLPSSREDGIWGDVLKQSNQTKSGEDALKDTARQFTKEKLLSPLPVEDSGITFTDNSGEPWNTQVAICPPTEMQGGTNDPSKVVLDGYLVQSNWAHYGVGDEDNPAYKNNLATVLVTDHGVIGGELMMSYEMVEELPQVVAFLSFDDLMVELKGAIQDHFDVSKIKGSSLRITSANLVFCAVDSPNSPNEAVFVPAWQFWAESNGGAGIIYLNIVDGSLIDIYYFN